MVPVKVRGENSQMQRSEDATLLALKIEKGTITRERWWLLEAERVKQVDYSLKLLGVQSQRHHDFGFFPRHISEL